MRNAEQPSPWLNTEQAAKYLGASPKTLAIWRVKGQGPRYHNVNKRLVRYHVGDLDAHILNRPGVGIPAASQINPTQT